MRTWDLFPDGRVLKGGMGAANRGVRPMVYVLRPNTVELIPTLGALFPRGGPVQEPVLTYVGVYGVLCTNRGERHSVDSVDARGGV